MILETGIPGQARLKNIFHNKKVREAISALQAFWSNSGKRFFEECLRQSEISIFNR